MKRFRRLWITLAVCVSLAIALGWFTAYARRRFAQQHPRPCAVRFSSVAHDFGQVAQGQSLQCEFAYRNVGDQKVRARAVHSSCGCIVDESEKSWLSPGHSDVIRVTLNTEPYQPPKALSERILVQFEPGDAPPTVLTVKAMVSPEVVPEPPKLVCPQRAGRDKTVLKLTLKRGVLSRKAFAGVELASSASYCEVENPSRSQDKTEFRITVLHGKAPAHPRSLLVRYRGDSGSQREIRIPVQFERSPDEVVVAPRQYFQMVQHALDSRALLSASRQEFQLLPGKVKHLTITGIDAHENQNLAWEIHSGEEPGRFSVWLKEVPSRQLYSTTLDVHYKSASNGDRGVVSLDATVFVQRNHLVR